jgi:hypothetical protein
MEKRIDGLWVFRIVVKALIPLMFFVIASFPGSYWMAGVMLILTLAFYVLQWEKLGENKYIK